MSSAIEIIQKIADSLKELQAIYTQVNSPMPILPNGYTEFLSKFKFKIYAHNTFDRYTHFSNPYTHLFHSEDFGDGATMCLIGVEDQEEPNKPDGWTDILLPIFHNNKSVHSCPNLPADEWIFYVDMAVSGGYKKEIYFYEKETWKLLFTYSVKDGLCIGGTTVKTSVGYIEYCPRLDQICAPLISR